MQAEGPLAGIRVLDFTAMIAGPYCTRLLADSGAEVVKVKSPAGDYMRARGPLRDGPDGKQYSAYFGTLNCGKHSVVLDLKQDKDRKAAVDLAAKADVVVENFRPGVMKRLGLDYETLARSSPALIYCSISGYGQSGSSAHLPSYAPIMHAACGFDLANLGYQDGLEAPLKNGIFTADVLSGVHAYGAISAGLVRRHRTGRGDQIDVTLLDAMLGLLVYECQEAQFPAERRRPLYRPLKTLDGFVIVAPISAGNFQDMARTVGHPEWITDARFVDTGARERNWDVLMDLMQEWARERTAEDCESTMLAGGVPCSRYFTVAEAMRSTPLAERGSLTAVRDGAGDFLTTNPAFKMTEARTAAKPWVDALGASTDAVFNRWKV